MDVAVVARGVEHLVEISLEGHVAIDIPSLDQSTHALHEEIKGGAFFCRHAPRRRARGDALELDVELEAFNDRANCQRRDRRALARTGFDEADGGELQECLADRRARDAEAGRQRLLVEA